MLANLLAGNLPPAAPVARVVDQSPVLTLDCIESLGDEPWFADTEFRRKLREKVAAVHKEQKIIVGVPAEEIKRICPGGGRVLGAGAVLRLGGSFGGFGESDINYVFRQLSRALHPDKNPGVVEAPDSFKRLADAADELRAGLTESRKLLQQLGAYTGAQIAPEMLERPQEALFAEASKLASVVLALTGEGKVEPFTCQKAVAAVKAAPEYAGCDTQVIVAQFWGHPILLDIIASAQLRSAYDCAPKRLRTQFLCALNRISLAEADRNSGCVRANWQQIMEQFPELGLCRVLREKLLARTWITDPFLVTTATVQEGGDEANLSDWAKAWRQGIKAIFGSKGQRTAASISDPEVRSMICMLWSDISKWAITQDMQDNLALFIADDADPEDPKPMWLFVPAVDILLTVGDGILGATVEGLFFYRATHKPSWIKDAGAKQKPAAEEDHDVLWPTLPARVPEGMRGVPPPSEDDIAGAVQSASSKGYDTRALPKPIVPGCHGKWGIGLWCRSCKAYVAFVKKPKWGDKWWISDDGGCSHFGGKLFTAGRLSSTVDRAEAGTTVSDHDLHRAIAAAVEGRVKAFQAHQQDPELARREELSEAMNGRAREIQVQQEQQQQLQQHQQQQLQQQQQQQQRQAMFGRATSAYRTNDTDVESAFQAHQEIALRQFQAPPTQDLPPAGYSLAQSGDSNAGNDTSALLAMLQQQEQQLQWQGNQSCPRSRSPRRPAQKASKWDAWSCVD